MRKRTPIKLQLPEPCAENWDEMSPDDQGKHCQKCSTMVTDFTNMTDSEIINYLSKGKGSVCGLFKNSQMNRQLEQAVPIQRFSQRFFPCSAFGCFGIINPSQHSRSRPR